MAYKDGYMYQTSRANRSFCTTVATWTTHALLRIERDILTEHCLQLTVLCVLEHKRDSDDDINAVYKDMR